MSVVLHITEKLERHGGTPRKLLSLVQHDQGLRHSFVTFLPGDLDAEMRTAGATVACANSTTIATIVRATVAAARREHAEVICTHFTRALVCGVLAGRWLSMPVIHNVHGPASDVPRATLSGHLGRLASYWALPQVKLIGANSRFSADTMRRVYGLPESKVRVLPCPVTLRVRNGGAHDLPARAPGRLRLVQIGGLIPVRQQHLLLQGLARLQALQVDAELLMVGDGPRRAELQALAQSLDITSRVHWLGIREDIGDVLAEADVYVSAINNEGFGIAVVEAMLQGLPSVLPNGGAHPEITDGGRCGVLYDSTDSEAFARAVAALWQDAPRRAAISDAGRIFAGQMFAPARYAERFGRFIDEAQLA
ncbi:MAG: glycosyltransferase family 4 protein [Pseudomonadota bacterium]